MREFEGVASLLDGIDINKIPLEALRGGLVSVVPQEPLLFSGAIRNSLSTACGGECDEDEDALLYEVLEKVQMRAFVEGRGGLDGFSVDASGSDLSFGQKQL